MIESRPFCLAKCLNMFSAEGDLQMFPRQTNNTRTTPRSIDESILSHFVMSFTLSIQSYIFYESICVFVCMRHLYPNISDS